MSTHDPFPPAAPARRSLGPLALVAALAVVVLGSAGLVFDHGQRTAAHHEAVMAHLDQRDEMIDHLVLSQATLTADRAELEARLATHHAEAEAERLAALEASQLDAPVADREPEADAASAPDKAPATSKRPAPKKRSKSRTKAETSTPSETTAPAIRERKNKFVLDSSLDPLGGL